jgi:hypothetical protein
MSTIYQTILATIKVVCLWFRLQDAQVYIIFAQITLRISEILVTSYPNLLFIATPISNSCHIRQKPDELLLLAYLFELVSNELSSKARILVQIFAQYAIESKNDFHLESRFDLNSYPSHLRQVASQ